MDSDGHRVVTIPELLHLIFSSSDTYSVTIDMQVCKLWAKVGETVLWRVVESEEQFGGFLKILAPWDFEGKFIPPLLPNWRRFLECSRLVHTLTIDWSWYDDPDDAYEIVYSILEFISESRPVSDVFPNLHLLESCSYQDTRHASIFLHSGVKRWSIISNNFPGHVASMPLIPTDPIQRLSGLVQLRLGYGIVTEDLLPTFVVLKDLPCLSSIVLPRHTVSYAVLEALSMFPILHEIRTTGRSHSRPCQGDHILPRPFRKKAFPKLTTLTISGCSYMISRLLDDDHFPFHITDLAVESSVCSENLTFSVYPKIVAKCPQVTDFVLRDVVVDTSSSFSSLRVFLSLDLTRLRVDTYRQLSYDTREIEGLSRSLPNIQFLSLAPRPNLKDNPVETFGFKHLCLFARHCPKLIKFAILLDTTQSCEPWTRGFVVPFAVLEELDLGLTFKTGKLNNAAAILLAELLPTYCHLTFNCDDYPPTSTIHDAILEARAAKEERELDERANVSF